MDSALATGKIFEGEGFKYIQECFAEGTLHLIGLLSDGGVHSRLDQLQVCFFMRKFLEKNNSFVHIQFNFLLSLVAIFVVAAERC